jgi:hypothetical protein
MTLADAFACLLAGLFAYYTTSLPDPVTCPRDAPSRVDLLID